ncbi:MAG: 6-phosphogluconolactonase [Bacteroidota bacterium]
MPSQVHISKDAPAVAKNFARFFAEQLQGQDYFSVALSGGSTPKILFQLWAEEYRNKIDWSVVHFFWGDERCVPPDDNESNFGVCKTLLLDHIDIPAENIHRVRGEAPPAEEVKRYGLEIIDNTDTVNDLPAFDLIILGMGDDGHTASIFPHQMELLTAKKPTVIAQHPTSGQTRISLSGTLINNARSVAFLVTGVKKQEKLNSILNRDIDAHTYPAAHILPASGELYWFVDEAAMSSYDTALRHQDTKD